MTFAFDAIVYIALALVALAEWLGFDLEQEKH